METLKFKQEESLLFFENESHITVACPERWVEGYTAYAPGW